MSRIRTLVIALFAVVAVIPMMPAGAQGLDEQQLAALVTRDAMIGTGLALQP